MTGKAEGKRGFDPLPKRWVVELTLGCLLRWRRLVRELERLPGRGEAMVELASIHRMACRVRPPRWRKKLCYRRPLNALV